MSLSLIAHLHTAGILSITGIICDLFVYSMVLFTLISKVMII